MKYPFYISIIAIFIALTACEDKITLDVPDGVTKLVVDGTLKSSDPNQKITLSLTNEYFSNEPTPRVSNAQVRVTSSEGEEFTFTENDVIKGQYDGIIQLKDSVEYTLNVVTPDGNVYQSFSERVNRVPPIDSLYQSDSMVGSEDEDAFRSRGYFVMLSTVEPPGVGDYYRWIIYVNGEQQIDPFNLNIVEDVIFDGRPIIDWDIQYELQPNDTVVIEQMSISKRCYNFWFLVQQQLTNFGGPFDTPPAPIEGNVYNVNDPDEPVLGYFGVSKVSKETIIIEDLEN